MSFKKNVAMFCHLLHGTAYLRLKCNLYDHYKVNSQSTAKDDAPDYEVNTSPVERDILGLICRIPGIRYREIGKVTGMSNGILSHHLKNLEGRGCTRVLRRIGVTRFYPRNTSEKELVIISEIRREPMRKIIEILLEKESCTFSEIVKNTEKSPSTISVQVKHLKEVGIIWARNDSQWQSLVLLEKGEVIRLLSRYTSSRDGRFNKDNFEHTSE